MDVQKKPTARSWFCYRKGPPSAFSLRLSLIMVVACNPSAYAQKVHVAAETKEVVNRIETIGSVSPAESSIISPMRDMVIRKFLVLPGQNVKKGQKIAEIDIKSVASELKYLKPYRDVAARNVKLAQINLEVAQEKLERTRILAERGILKGSDLDQSKSAASSALRAHESSLANLVDVESKIKDVNQRLEEVALVSPQDGYVAQMIVDPRQLSGFYAARAGTKLARIDRPGIYKIEARMSDRDFLRLAAFPRCEVRLPSYPPLPCTTVPPQGVPERSPEAVSAVFPVSAKFHFDSLNIPLGMEATLILLSAKADRRLLLPWNAVEVEPGKTFVRKKGTDGMTRTPVNLGWRDGNYVEILSGIQEGEVVEAQIWPPAKIKS